MQQFVVPQFIEVEDKIFGPITTRQFLILLGAGILLFVMYKLADFTTFIISLAVIGGLALIFAFVRINGQAFHYFVLNIVQTAKKPSLRIWNKDLSTEELNFLRKQTIEEAAEQEAVIARATPHHIRDLSLLVNTGGYYRPEGGLHPQEQDKVMPLQA